MRNQSLCYEPHEYAALMDAAKQRARYLRQQAISDFWTDVNECSVHTARSLTRYLSRLYRHRRLRIQSNTYSLTLKED
jgi:hypothetical protein